MGKKKRKETEGDAVIDNTVRNTEVKSVQPYHNRVTAPVPRSPRTPIHHCRTGTGLPAAAPMAFPFELNRRAHVSDGLGGPTMLAVGLFATVLPLAESLEAVIVNLLETE